MEAFLLTLDIAMMVWLCWLVRRSASGKMGATLGWFGYRGEAQPEAVSNSTKLTKGSGRA